MMAIIRKSDVQSAQVILQNNIKLHSTKADQRSDLIKIDLATIARIEWKMSVWLPWKHTVSHITTYTSVENELLRWLEAYKLMKSQKWWYILIPVRQTHEWIGLHLSESECYIKWRRCPLCSYFFFALPVNNAHLHPTSWNTLVCQERYHIGHLELDGKAEMKSVQLQQTYNLLQLQQWNTITYPLNKTNIFTKHLWKY